MHEVEKVLRNQELYGLDKKPDFINLDKEADHRGVEYHPKHRVHLEAQEEYLRRKLSEELILEPTKVLKIATAGHVEQEVISRPTVQKMKKEVLNALILPRILKKPFFTKILFKYTDLRTLPQMRVYMKKKKF